MMFSCVFVTFPYGALGQVWYLIASILIFAFFLTLTTTEPITKIWPVNIVKPPIPIALVALCSKAVVLLISHYLLLPSLIVGFYVGSLFGAVQ